MLRRKDEEIAIHGPVGLFEALTAAGRKGISLQRYKGLGEMNPEQLWETTLDTNARSLLQVRVKEVDEAEMLFDRADGRPGRAAPAIHPGQRARRQRRRLTYCRRAPGLLSRRFSRRRGPSRRARRRPALPASSSLRNRRSCRNNRPTHIRASREDIQCSGAAHRDPRVGR